MIAVTVGGAIVATGAGLGLAAMRRWGSGRSRPRTPWADSAAGGLSLVAAGSLGFTMLAPGAQWVRLEHPAPWIVGLALGTALAIVRWCLDLIAVLHRWGTHRPVELDAADHIVIDMAAEWIGLMGFGVLLALVASVVGGSAALSWIAVPIAVASYPAYEQGIKPTLVLSRLVARTSIGAWVPGVESFLSTTASRYRLGRLRVVIIPGGTINAFAAGFRGLGYWVGLGEALLRELDTDEREAVIAHELAHLIRRDVRRLVAIAAACGSVHAVVLAFAVFPFFDAGRLAEGLVMAALSAGVLLGLAPGWMSRRAEYATDRLAVRLTDKPHALCRALVKLAVASGDRLDRGSITHPAPAHRIARIHALRP